MTSCEAVVHERAKEFEVQELKKMILSPEHITTLETLLLDVCAILHPKPSDYNDRRDLLEAIDELVKKTLGSGNGFPIVEAFGSFIMDIFTTKSDLDLSVNISNIAAGCPREKKISILRKLSKRLYALQSKGHIFSVQPIYGARVPVLKAVDSGTRIECDISVENKDGIARSVILHIVSSIDERFRKLSFLMKAWAKAHGINSSKHQTLNSLSIVSLVAFHLQNRDPPILPPFSALLKDGIDTASVKNAVIRFQHFGRQNEESLAELFVTLLIKLSSVETLWLHGLCASTYEGSWISKTWKRGNIRVEDFKDRSQNTARSVGKNQVEKIYKCIHDSVQNLSSFMAGQIQAPKLKELLFGGEIILTSNKESTSNKGMTSRKRNSTSHGSAAQLNSVSKKRKRKKRNNGEDQAHSGTNQASVDTTGHLAALTNLPALLHHRPTYTNQVSVDAEGHVAALTNPRAPLHPRSSYTNRVSVDTAGHLAALTNKPAPLHPRLSYTNRVSVDTAGHLAALTNPPAPLQPRPFYPPKRRHASQQNPIAFGGAHSPNVILCPSLGFGGPHRPNMMPCSTMGINESRLNPTLRPTVGFGGSHRQNPTFYPPIGSVGSHCPVPTSHPPVGFDGSYRQDPTSRPPL